MQRDVNTNGVYGGATEANSVLTTQGHSFTWDINGIHSNSIWEMDQLEINGETITVPMTSLADTAPRTETTILSTGTVVTLTVQSLGAEGGNKRHYVLQIDNCYENLTVSGGNMVGNNHKEFVMRMLQGVENSQFWSSISGSAVTQNFWNTLRQDSLLDKRNQGNQIDDPFRVKVQAGCQNMHVSFTTKESDPLQTDGNCYESGEYVEYLIRTDTGNTDNLGVKGIYEVVPYSQWHASEDEYFYFRATSALRSLMGSSQYGVILINIYADPIRAGMDYRNGAGDGIAAPVEANIENMPQYQNGGPYGYNIQTNPTALVSNRTPVDKTGEFIFDHWEILVVEGNEPSTTSKKDNGVTMEIKPGEDIHVSQKIVSLLSDCLYYNLEAERNILTLKACWTSRMPNLPIPYTVRYILADLNGGELTNKRQIEEHTHTVNEGAMLVTDLYQDGNKTLSASIQAVLEGENAYGTDYTREANWEVYEPATTKKIESVSPGNNVAEIYLIKKTASVTVTKE